MVRTQHIYVVPGLAEMMNVGFCWMGKSISWKAILSVVQSIFMSADVGNWDELEFTFWNTQIFWVDDWIDEGDGVAYLVPFNWEMGD